MAANCEAGNCSLVLGTLPKEEREIIKKFYSHLEKNNF